MLNDDSLKFTPGPYVFLALVQADEPALSRSKPLGPELEIGSWGTASLKMNT